MSDISARLEQMRLKVAQASAKMEALTATQNSLQQEVASLKRRLADEQSKLAMLQEEYERLKLAKTVVTASGDKATMKYKVNEMVKEIDRCIALLNK